MTSLSAGIETSASNRDLVAEGSRQRRILIIEASGRWPRIDVRELWDFRDLLYFLVWRDIKIRYAQTVLGAGWAILQPVLTMVIFTVVFSKLAHLPSDGVPYPLFSLAALVPWTYFSTAVSGAGNSLVANTSLITKVYFPRLVIPLAPVLGGMIDFGVGLTLLLTVSLVFGVVPSPWVFLAMPLLILAMMTTAAGIGALTAVLNLQYRDVKYVLPFLLQIWMYASPVAYPLSLVPERFRLLYALNPMVGVIEGFRAALLRTSAVPWSSLALSFAVAIAIFVAGAFHFRRSERLFADIA